MKRWGQTEATQVRLSFRDEDEVRRHARAEKILALLPVEASRNKPCGVCETRSHRIRDREMQIAPTGSLSDLKAANDSNGGNSTDLASLVYAARNTDVPVAPEHPIVALGPFNAHEYGGEYVSLHCGDIVTFRRSPTGETADHDWSYGEVAGRGEGWFPTQLVWRPWPPWNEVAASLGILDDNGDALNEDTERSVRTGAKSCSD